MDELIDEYMNLRAEKARIEAELEPVTSRLGEVEWEIVKKFRESGTQSIKRNGKLVYPTRDITVKVNNREQVADYFIAEGNAEMLSVNSATLKSWCKQTLWNADLNDWEATPLNLPDAMRGAVDLGERYSLGFRKG